MPNTWHLKSFRLHLFPVLVSSPYFWKIVCPYGQVLKRMAGNIAVNGLVAFKQAVINKKQLLTKADLCSKPSTLFLFRGRPSPCGDVGNKASRWRWPGPIHRPTGRGLPYSHSELAQPFTGITCKSCISRRAHGISSHSLLALPFPFLSSGSSL